jgi:hypothetical protein
VNLSHRLSGVFIGILTIALWGGGCSVTRPTESPPPAVSQGAPGRATGDLPRPLPVAGVVRSIEAMQVPEERAVRCVVYLQHMTPHIVEIQGRQLLITLAHTAPRSAEMLPAAASETAGASRRLEHCHKCKSNSNRTRTVWRSISSRPNSVPRKKKP